MWGIVLGAGMRLLTGGAKVSMDMFQQSQKEKVDAAAWARQKELMQMEAAAAAKSQEITAESEERVAEEKTLRAAISAQRDMKGASQWVINFSKMTRPGITWLIILTVEVAVFVMLFRGAMDLQEFFGFHAPIMEVILGFWFAGRVMEKRSAKM